jgi:hypothetical protein
MEPNERLVMDKQTSQRLKMGGWTVGVLVALGLALVAGLYYWAFGVTVLVVALAILAFAWRGRQNKTRAGVG